jgi:hypothetical protein
VAVDQVPVRHVDEDLVAVVRRRRVRLVVATEKIERGVLQAGLGTTDQTKQQNRKACAIIEPSPITDCLNWLLLRTQPRLQQAL